MQTMSFRAPEEMVASIEIIAKKFDRSKEYLIRQALESYIEDMEDYIDAKNYKDSYNLENNISFDKIKQKYKANK